jgi:IS4 transposase
MALDDVLDRFAEESPVSVMWRGTMENVFSAERLDALFAETAQRQTTKTLLFSMCVDLMAVVVTQIRPSVHAAYQRKRETLGVSVAAVYDKLSGIEPQVSRRLVQATASDLAETIRSMGGARPSPLPGYEVRIVDGNHLPGAEHRLKELRALGAAALPGHALAILDPQAMLIEDAIPCEDGHAHERTLLPELSTLARPGQCWLADRAFCTIAFLTALHRRGARFVVRQHGQLKGRLVGERRELGRTKTGRVYEQAIEIGPPANPLRLRRITVELDEPTRDGDREMHVLTDLPEEVDGRLVAEAYRERWTVETAFQHLAVALRSEVRTLGYPDAALFGFCTAVALYNVLSALRAALRVAHRLDEKKRTVSMQNLAEEIAGVSRGMSIAVPVDRWSLFAALSAEELGRELLHLARKVDVRCYLARPARPKRPPPRRTSGGRGQHVSVQRLLDARRTPAEK